MATRLRRSDRNSWVPLAAGSSARSPGPLAEQEAANDRHVHGCGDRQQLTNDHLPLDVHLGATFDDVERDHLVGTSHET